MKRFLLMFTLILFISLCGCSETKNDELEQTNIHETNTMSEGGIFKKHLENSSGSSPVLTFDNKDYNLDTELHILTDELTKDQLGYLRNGIYAKYGYKFKTKMYSDYFSKFSWYKPGKDNVDDLLNNIDQKNIKLILDLEKKINLRTLTNKEITDFEKELGDKSNCGFLTCEYSETSKIDPSEVFYGGCGLNKSISEAEKRDLIKNYGFSEDDFMLDHIKIKTTDINNLLLKKVGLTLKGIEKKLGYKYVPKYDAYYCFRGDTNYIDLKCNNGTVSSEGIYEINYTAYVHSSTPVKRKVTFKISDNSIVFMSNVNVN